MDEPSVYLVGGGIAALASATLLIEEAGIAAERIHILEQDDVIGGSLDGSGSVDAGFLIRGGRMFEEHMPTLWDLLARVPSLEDPPKSIRDEIFAFNQIVVPDARCRLVKNALEKVDVSSYGFDGRDRADLLRLVLTPERLLDGQTIEDGFSPHFFRTLFWLLWQTTFAFQAWSSLAEMRRYFLRFIHLFPEFHRLGGILRTEHNQTDSIVQPVTRWLAGQGVHFETRTIVTDVTFEIEPGHKRITGLQHVRNGRVGETKIGRSDFVFITLGSIAAASSVGSWDAPAMLKEKKQAPEWLLWDRIALRSPDFGSPSAFDDRIDRSKWQSCTITFRNARFFEIMERFTGNAAGTGGLVTLVDSSWRLSFFLPFQPHFLNQPADAWVFWAYGLFPDEDGDFVNKKMSSCTGREIVVELLHHLKLEKEIESLTQNDAAIPCLMPFADSEFLPRRNGDRPKVVLDGAENFAFLGQFTEIPHDVVFTVEYSIRSARIAVQTLFDVDGRVPPVYVGLFDGRVVRDAIRAMWR